MVPITPEQFEVFWVNAWCFDHPQHFDATMWNTKNLSITSISTLPQKDICMNTQTVFVYVDLCSFERIGIYYLHSQGRDVWNNWPSCPWLPWQPSSSWHHPAQHWCSFQHGSVLLMSRKQLDKDQNQTSNFTMILAVCRVACWNSYRANLSFCAVLHVKFAHRHLSRCLS